MAEIYRRFEKPSTIIFTSKMASACFQELVSYSWDAWKKAFRSSCKAPIDVRLCV